MSSYQEGGAKLASIPRFLKKTRLKAKKSYVKHANKNFNHKTDLVYKYQGHDRLVNIDLFNQTIIRELAAFSDL